MKKNTLFLLALLFIAGCESDDKIHAIDLDQHAFTISGDIEQEVVISTQDLQKFEPRLLGDLELKKGDGSVYMRLHKAEGVLLNDVLRSLSIKGMDNKKFSSFFVICTATDGYRIMFSWNELFNTKVGDQVFLITAANGQSIREMPESIMMVSLEDRVNGKRNLRKLATMEVLAY